MADTISRPRWAIAAALIALALGVLTIIAGGKTLFDPAERAAAGNIVPFVLWFNFIAGFAYVAAAFGIFRWKPWGAQLSALIALATVVVFAAFAVHVFAGGAFEARTVGAMTVRSLVWLAIAITTCRAFGCFPLRARRLQLPG